MEIDVETGIEIDIETGVESIYLFIFLWLLWPVSGFGCCVVSRFGGDMWPVSCGCCGGFLVVLAVAWVSIWIWGGGF